MKGWIMKLQKRHNGLIAVLSLPVIWVAAVMLFCLCLSGCQNKSCADYEKQLNRYADGSDSISDPAGVLKDCKAALDKCPAQSVPFEVMGDIDAKNEKFAAAIQNYEKALAKNAGSQRVKAKLEKAVAAKEEADAAQFASIKAMTLSKYAALDESTRISWCERLMDQPKKISSVETIYSITSKQLDAELLRVAASEPERPMWNVATFYVMSNMQIKKR